VIGAWKQISKQRRRVDVSYDPRMITDQQQGTWMEEEGFKKTCNLNFIGFFHFRTLASDDDDCFYYFQQ